MKSISVSNKMLKAAQDSYEEHSHPSYGLTDADMKAAISAALALAPDQQSEIERLRSLHARDQAHITEQANKLRIAEAERDELLAAVDAEIKRSRRHLSAATLATHAKLKEEVR